MKQTEIAIRRALRPAMIRLRCEYSQLLLMRDSGYSQQEIAEEWGVTQQAVSQMEKRALKRLLEIAVLITEGR